MDVTIDNFPEALEAFQEHIPHSLFLSLDLEFTGFGLEIGSKLQTPQERYELARRFATDYPPCQFGLTLFRAPSECSDVDDSDSCAWDVVPFNFWLFQRPVKRRASAQYPVCDAEIKMQACCVEFLWRSGFDFNKMFGKGISWLRKDAEDAVVELDQEYGKLESGRSGRVADSQLSARDLRWVEENVVNELNREFDEGSRTSRSAHRQSTVLARHDSPLVRKYVFDLIGDKYPRLFARTLKFNGDLVLVVEECATANDAKARADEFRKQQTEEVMRARLEKHVGFRKIIDIIVEAKLPVVVHNGLYDMCKIYANFIGDLPDQLANFKVAFHRAFPIVVDTKHVLDEYVVPRFPWVDAVMKTKKYDRESALEGLDAKLDGEFQRHGLDTVQIRLYHRNTVEAGQVAFSETGGFDGDFASPVSSYFHMSAQRNGHEAGYDAMVTGKLFLQLSAILCGKLHEPRSMIDGKNAVMQILDDLAIAPMVNHLAISSCGGFVSLDLAAGDATAEETNKYKGRRDIVVLFGFGKLFRMSNWGEASVAEMMRMTEEVLADSPFDANVRDACTVVNYDALLLKLRGKVGGSIGVSGLTKGKDSVAVPDIVDTEPVVVTPRAGCEAEATAAREGRPILGSVETAGAGGVSGGESRVQVDISRDQHAVAVEEQSEHCPGAPTSKRGVTGGSKRKRAFHEMLESPTAGNETLCATNEQGMSQTPVAHCVTEERLEMLRASAMSHGLSVVTYDEAIRRGGWRRVRLSAQTVGKLTRGH